MSVVSARHAHYEIEDVVVDEALHVPSVPIAAQSAVAGEDGEAQDQEFIEQDGDPEGVKVARQRSGPACAEARKWLARD